MPVETGPIRLLRVSNHAWVHDLNRDNQQS